MIMTPTADVLKRAREQKEAKYRTPEVGIRREIAAAAPEPVVAPESEPGIDEAGKEDDSSLE